MGGNLTDDNLDELKHRGEPHSNIKHFVETGTYKGDTSILASKHFKHVHTIEIHEPLHLESKARCSDLGITNINFILGDSLEKLNTVMDTLNGDGAVFFIDAHISGSDSGWNQKTRVPLMEELEIILQQKIGPSVFILDDVRLWKSIRAWDWVHITNQSIVDKFKEHSVPVISYYEKDDRFFVFTM